MYNTVKFPTLYKLHEHVNKLIILVRVDKLQKQQWGHVSDAAATRKPCAAKMKTETAGLTLMMKGWCILAMIDFSYATALA